MGNIQKPDRANVGSGWLFEISHSTLICDRFWSTFGAIFCFATLAYVIWRNKQSEKIKGEFKMNNTLWWATIITIIVFGVSQLSSMSLAFPWLYSFTKCAYLSWINLALYYSSKFCLWTYSIIRLHDVFHKSGTLAYSDNFLKGLVIFFGFEVFLINILADLYDDQFVYEGLCVVITPDWIPGVIAMIDIVSNVACLWLFYYKMKKLWKMISSVNEIITAQTVELAYIIRKYTVLTAFSVVSTILLGASVAITPIFWTVLTFDTIINVVCLTLFDKRFDRYYQILCCCCAKRIKFDKIIQIIRNKPLISDKTATLDIKVQAGIHVPVPSKTQTPTTTNNSNLTTNGISVAHGTMDSGTLTQRNQSTTVNSHIQLSTIEDAPETITRYDVDSNEKSKTVPSNVTEKSKSNPSE
eukprot:499113_1